MSAPSFLAKATALACVICGTNKIKPGLAQTCSKDCLRRLEQCLSYHHCRARPTDYSSMTYYVAATARGGSAAVEPADSLDMEKNRIIIGKSIDITETPEYKFLLGQICSYKDLMNLVGDEYLKRSPDTTRRELNQTFQRANMYAKARSIPIAEAMLLIKKPILAYMCREACVRKLSSEIFKSDHQYHAGLVEYEDMFSKYRTLYAALNRRSDRRSLLRANLTSFAKIGIKIARIEPFRPASNSYITMNTPLEESRIRIGMMAKQAVVFLTRNSKYVRPANIVGPITLLYDVLDAMIGSEITLQGIGGSIFGLTLRELEEAYNDIRMPGKIECRHLARMSMTTFPWPDVCENVRMLEWKKDIARTVQAADNLKMENSIILWTKSAAIQVPVLKMPDAEFIPTECERVAYGHFPAGGILTKMFDLTMTRAGFLTSTCDVFYETASGDWTARRLDREIRLVDIRALALPHGVYIGNGIFLGAETPAFESEYNFFLENEEKNIYDAVEKAVKSDEWDIASPPPGIILDAYNLENTVPQLVTRSPFLGEKSLYAWLIENYGYDRLDRGYKDRPRNEALVSFLSRLNAFLSRSITQIALYFGKTGEVSGYIDEVEFHSRSGRRSDGSNWPATLPYDLLD